MVYNLLNMQEGLSKNLLNEIIKSRKFISKKYIEKHEKMDLLECNRLKEKIKILIFY